jgi:hypothetical protein
MIRYTALLEKDFRFYYSETFAFLYQALVNNRETKVFEDMSTMFTFMASIGLKNNLKLEYKEKNSSNQIRLQTLKDKHLNSIYSMIFQLRVLNIGLSVMTEKDFLNGSLKEIELYAEGGMNYVFERYLKTFINGQTLLKSETSYDYIFTKIILDQVLSIEQSHQNTEKVNVGLSTKTKSKIIDYRPSVYLKQTVLCNETILPLKAKIYFIDQNYMPLSNEKVVHFEATEQLNDIHLDFDLNHQLNLPSNIFMVIEDIETSNIVKKFTFEVQINFKSNLL